MSVRLRFIVLGLWALAAISVSAGPSVENFFTSLWRHDFTKAEELLDQGLDINERYRGDTALEDALNHWDVPIVDFLLRHNADVSQVSSKGDSLLHMAIYKGAPFDLVRKILDAGVSPFTVRAGETHIQRWTPEIVEHMAGKVLERLGKEPDRHQVALSVASDCGRLKLGGPYCRALVSRLHRARFLKALVEENFNEARTIAEQYDIIEAEGSNGRRPLHLFLSKDSSLPIVKALVDMGANVNSTTESGSSPLSIALRSKALKVAKFLLDNGASPVNRDSAGRTPLEYAKLLGDQDLINRLTEALEMQG